MELFCFLSLQRRDGDEDGNEKGKKNLAPPLAHGIKQRSPLLVSCRESSVSDVVRRLTTAAKLLVEWLQTRAATLRVRARKREPTAWRNPFPFFPDTFSLERAGRRRFCVSAAAAAASSRLAVLISHQKGVAKKPTLRVLVRVLEPIVLKVLVPCSTSIILQRVALQVLVLVLVPGTRYGYFFMGYRNGSRLREMCWVLTSRHRKRVGRNKAIHLSIGCDFLLVPSVAKSTFVKKAKGRPTTIC